MPSRRQFLSTLDGQFDKMKHKLKAVSTSQKNICVTCDVWSSRAQSYLGMTIHFLNAFFERESFVLAFKRLHDRQTHSQLAKAMHSVFLDFDIEIDKITNVVNDGGSAFCKLFKVYGKDADAEIHDQINEDENEIELVTDGDDENSSETAQLYMRDENGELLSSEIITFEGESTSDTAFDEDDFDLASNAVCNEASNNFFDDVDPEPKIKMPPQRRCVSHKLNLLSSDFLKKLSVAASKAFVTSYGKLHALFVTTHRSSRAKSICKEVLGCVLSVPCPTRWNSQFDAIAKVIKNLALRQKINQLIQRLKNEISSATHLQILTNNDFHVLNEYINVMEPCACALDTLQGDKNCSQGLILPVLISMQHRITQISGESGIAREFKTTMLKAIQDRFEEYFTFTEENKDLILASITIPYIKADFIEHDYDFNKAKQFLIAECTRITHNHRDPAYDNIDIQKSSQHEKSFFVRFGGQRLTRSNSVESECESEVARFLSDEHTEVEILNNYPTIREIYFKFNTTLSSSGAVERLFSQSLMIFTPRRNRISDEKFEKILMLKHNRKLVTTD